MKMLYSYLIGFPSVRFLLSKSINLFPQSFNPCFMRVCSVLGTLLHSLSSALLNPVIYSFIFMIRFHNTTFKHIWWGLFTWENNPPWKWISKVLSFWHKAGTMYEHIVKLDRIRAESPEGSKLSFRYSHDDNSSSPREGQGLKQTKPDFKSTDIY